jgi:mannitol/fructose-specific phosphotransferase system IIA component
MEWLLEKTGLLLILAFISKEDELRLSKRYLASDRLYQPDFVEDIEERAHLIKTLQYISKSSSSQPDPCFSPRKNREILWKAFDIHGGGSISKKGNEELRILAELHFRLRKEDFEKILACIDEHSEYFVCLRI